ncbi:hypothetical protein XK09_01025 [Campylobacter lanienae]|uniref:Large polyvalent protein associated domain-containing protein n=1 Tax=Campylobacter lanienae TaxID=75658 RepID=A0ABY3GB05_9BACT|nr:LPD23 domain-containing protein [Campylobacter lanienae]TWO30725.1 hypothetical protein XK09_01025 [Campylobacter lanienae]
MILNLQNGKNFYFYNHAPNKITNPAPKSDYADKLIDGNEAIQGTYKISDEIKQDLIKSLKEFVGSRQNLAENIANIQSRWWYKIKEQERLAPSILEGGKKANNGYDENLKKALEHEVYLFNQFERRIVKNPQKTSSDLELANNYYRFSKGDTYTKKALDDISQTRQILEQELNIKPIKEFGTNYAEFYHDGANAIKKLLTERQGQVAGAFEREELGDIDLVWGEVTDAIKHKGYGLSHILDKRMAEFMEQGLSKEQSEAKAIELINKLPDIIKNGEIEQNGGRFRLQKDNYVIGLTSEYKGEKRNWIITAFERGNPQSFTEADFKAKSDNLLTNPNKNSTPKEIKSQDQTTQPMMNGFSTMAMEKAILHLGSGGMGGVMNANAEQDPNKKAEAFVKGFLLGAGGSVGAMKMLENSAKLAPQLARTSQRLAKDLPMILNDRPDIIGKALGRTPKENYNYIFGGENAIGANKAKLKTAREMAKNGADESEIWAKTGWYKDIDKKWKFEINPKGAELDISALKKAKPNKLGDILKDDELFKAYPQVKDLSILPTQTKDGANAIYHEAFGSRQKAIFFDYDYLQNATNDELKSTLYHEIQHAIQSIEGFASGGNTQKLSYEEYKNLAGESEARNVEKRLNRTYSKDDAIDGEFNRLLINDIDNPKWQELKQKRKELILAGKQDEADKIKKQLDQRQEFLKSQAVKNVERFSSYSPHPFKTLDINPNDRIVKYGSGMSASANPRQKAKQYAKWLSQADKMPPQAPDELYKAYDKAKRT